MEQETVETRNGRRLGKGWKRSDGMEMEMVKEVEMVREMDIGVGGCWVTAVVGGQQTVRQAALLQNLGG